MPPTSASLLAGTFIGDSVKSTKSSTSIGSIHGLYFNGEVKSMKLVDGSAPEVDGVGSSGLLLFSQCSNGSD